jgi:hypothetical protein
LVKLLLLCLLGLCLSFSGYASDNALVASSVYIQSIYVGEKNLLPEDIASASGIEDVNGHYYVVSDDSDYLYELDDKFQVVNTVNLFEKIRHSSKEHLDYKVKEDFESIAVASYNDQEILLALGSGSSPNRNTGIIYNVTTGEVIRVDLGSFYASFSDESINIESITFANEKSYIANRETNNIYIFDEDSLIHYLLDQSQSLPEAKMLHVKLPSIGSYQSTLSSLYYSQEAQALFFAASVELSYDHPLFDGVVLGSFVGAVPIQDLANNIDLGSYCHLLVNESGVIQTKVESVVVSDFLDGKFSVISVSDNDNGVSEMFYLTLFIDPEKS